MKNILLIGGIIAILFNSLAGVVLTSFPTHNWILADVNILFSTVLIFALYTRFFDNAFKIAFRSEERRVGKECRSRLSRVH